MKSDPVMVKMATSRSPPIYVRQNDRPQSIATCVRPMVSNPFAMFASANDLAAVLTQRPASILHTMPPFDPTNADL
jgi:hypothetical protein